MTLETLRHHQTLAGAELDADGTVLSFGQDALGLAAAQSGVALVDRSHWGLLSVGDADRLAFLHNQSTNAINPLKPGQGCETVFVTSTARTLDLATLYVLDEVVWLLVSPNRGEQLLKTLDRYIFFSDRVVLKDIRPDWATFTLVGPAADGLLEQVEVPVGTSAIGEAAHHHHQTARIAGVEVRIAVGTGLGLPGYQLFVPGEQGAIVWEALTSGAAAAVPLGSNGWEQLRIQQGRPMPDAELTEDYNPLEVGLWHTVSFEKGCYIGQETIARLNTYKGVKQRLWGVALTGPAAVGETVWVGEEKVGKLTSMTQLGQSLAQGFSGLAYVRTKAGGEGLAVRVGEVQGTLVALPYVTHPAE